MSYFIESEKKIRIIDEVDVLVAGGGTAGATAAIAAARQGMKVLIVEQFGVLGGSATAGLVTPLMNICIEGNPMCSSISDEINKRMIEIGYGASDNSNNNGFFDPLMLKFVLEEMVIEAGAKIMYYTYICDVMKDGDTVKGVIVENKAGRSAISASRIIDCTGDGDVAYKSGVPFSSGHPNTGRNQHMSLRYIVSGINMERFKAFLNEAGAQYTSPIVYAAVVWDKNWPLEPIFKKALDAGDITYQDGAYWQIFGIPGRFDSLAFNCPEISEGVDGTNPCDLTNAQVHGKKAIMRHLKFYKKYLPGFENCYISETAQQVGIRETRRINGLYELTDKDIMLCRKFDDSIVKSNYPIDVHSSKLLNEYMDMEGKDSVPYYEIPYRCLVPSGVKGMLVAGRCISSSFIAQSSLRIQPTVRAIGEAAGIAAAMSISRKVELDEINGSDVRAEMIKKGAKF